MVPAPVNPESQASRTEGTAGDKNVGSTIQKSSADVNTRAIANSGTVLTDRGIKDLPESTPGHREIPTAIYNRARIRQPPESVATKTAGLYREECRTVTQNSSLQNNNKREETPGRLHPTGVQDSTLDGNSSPVAREGANHGEPDVEVSKLTQISQSQRVLLMRTQASEESKVPLRSPNTAIDETSSTGGWGLSEGKTYSSAAEGEAVGSSEETARDPQVEEISRPRVREGQGSRSKPTATPTTSRNSRATAPVPGAAHSRRSEHRWQHGNRFPPMGNQIKESGEKEYPTRAMDGSAKPRTRVEDSQSSNGVS